MKAVMISIKPKWCELIASGGKTIEVRKTRPRVATPFKVYIYCTANKQGVKDLLEIHGTDGKIRKANGKVIGEFICKKMEICLVGYNTNTGVETYHELLDGSCLSANELMEYGKWKPLYGWHISDLVIYDKPKELSEFRMECKEVDAFNSKCECCEYYYSESNESIGFYDECLCDGLKPITRPPQSWCYVEHEEGAEDETD